MAKIKSSKSSKKAPPPSDPLLSAKTRHALIHSLLAFIALIVVVAGLYVLKNHVSRDIAIDGQPPRIVLKNRPAWMGDFLVEQITKTVRPTGAHPATDEQVLVDTADILAQNPWISVVHQVRRGYDKHPGDTIEIDCDFRVPVALAKWGTGYWLVDGAGVKLPEQYTTNLVPKVVLDRAGRTNIRIIEGVKSPPPDPGMVWPGEDLVAGLDMIKLLHAQPYADDVVKVDVSNFAGRMDVRESQVVLITKRNTQVRWGRPVNASDFFIEAPTARKLQYLTDIYNQYHRLDAGQPWVDIRFDKVTYPVVGTTDGKADPKAQNASADVRR